MQVFKAFFKITKKKLPSILTYVIIFFSVCIIVSSVTTDEHPSYETESMDIYVQDEDNTAASKALIDFLDISNEIKTESLSETELKDAIFYRDIDYALTIKSGYAEKIKNGETDDLFAANTLPSTFNGVYVENSLNQYIKLLNMYTAGGLTIDEALTKTAETCAEQAEVIVTGNDGNATNGTYTYNYFRMLPYILLMLFITGVTVVIITLRRQEMRERIICAPISSQSYTVQIILGTAIVCLIVWLLFVLAAIPLGGTENFFCKEGMLMILNSFVFAIVVIGISVLICSIMSSKNAEFGVTMVANIVGLGMSFLCGIFVPQYLLGEGVATVSRFLPAYWYVKSLDSISGFNGATFDYGEIFGAIGIQLLFAAALFAISLVVTKVKRTS